MTEFEEMIMPKIEEMAVPNPNQIWPANQMAPNNSNVEVDRYVLFEDPNLIDWNESRYALQQPTPRANKRRSSPASLQTQHLQLGEIMQELNIADAQVTQDFGESADLILNPLPTSFETGFIQRMPQMKEEIFNAQKFIESWGPMISGVAPPPGGPQLENTLPPYEPEFTRRHSIAVTGYDWRTNSPDGGITNTVEPKFIHDMSQIPCVLAPTATTVQSNPSFHNVDQNLYRLSANPMSRQDSQPLPSSVSPSSDVISSADSMTPTSQYIFGPEYPEPPKPMNNMSPEGYTTVSRKRSMVEELVEKPIIDMSLDMFQSPTDPSQRKRTKSIDFGLLSDPEAFSESEAYEYPLMTQEDMEKAEIDQNARPRRQRIRYPGDCYTPKWVRYSGQAKEGYCDSCQPGKWLQLKNSAYWYHKQFFHGISSVSGRQFMDPVDQRWGDQDAIEGLCHQCRHWISICTSKRKNSVLWYRHAHKCHIYHKPKATQAKRRPSVQF